jgi:hypothetical protein
LSDDEFSIVREATNRLAVYPEGESNAFISEIVPADAYDAVLFVDTTTVARKNGGR